MLQLDYKAESISHRCFDPATIGINQHNPRERVWEEADFYVIRPGWTAARTGSQPGKRKR
jgi:hypothetical protein